MMDERNQSQRIRRLLQDEEVQARVQENIRRGQAEVKVTIGRAEKLFNIRASKLREMDNLLQPGRSKDMTSVQRLYSLTELNKIAIISELLNNGLSLSDIPADIDEIWSSIIGAFGSTNHIAGSANRPVALLSVDKRVRNANQEAFLRYFISQALNIALNLICEDIPEPIAGIILPLYRETNATMTLNSADVHTLGECLIGWRDKNRAYTTFYTSITRFDFASDFRVRGLKAKNEPEPLDKTFIVLQRTTMLLDLSLPVVETIRKLLAPIYEDVHIWRAYFDEGMKDVVYPIIPVSGTTLPNAMLNAFADMAVRLGRTMPYASESALWKFCALLLPDNNPALSLQQHSLIVQAQSQQSPHEIGKTIVSPDTPILSLSLRAFQSIRVLYHSLISGKDETIAYRDQEGPIQSAIAIPIAGKDGLPIAVMYLVSDKKAAFDVEHLRVLRLLGLMIGGLLEPANLLQQDEERISDIITQPYIVNKTLGMFPSENEFVQDVEAILHDIEEHGSPSMEGMTSFISIDVDDLSKQTDMYGDQVLVSLSKAIGNRIEGQMGLLFDKQKSRLYHVYADRFYLLLDDVSLEQVRENAEKLRLALRGNYTVSILPTSSQASPTLQRGRVMVSDITVRLGASWYSHAKFYKLLNEHPEHSPETRIAGVMAGSVLFFLDEGLNIARRAGGDCIASYYPPDSPKYEHSRFDLWSPASHKK